MRRGHSRWNSIRTAWSTMTGVLSELAAEGLYALIPFAIALFAISGLIVLGHFAAPLAPFIYSLF